MNAAALGGANVKLLEVKKGAKDKAGSEFREFRELTIEVTGSRGAVKDRRQLLHRRENLCKVDREGG